MAVAFIQASRRLKVIVHLTIDTSENRQCIQIRKTNLNSKSYCSSLIFRGSIYQGDLDSVGHSLNPFSYWDTKSSTPYPFFASLPNASYIIKPHIL